MKFRCWYTYRDTFAEHYLQQLVRALEVQYDGSAEPGSTTASQDSHPSFFARHRKPPLEMDVFLVSCEGEAALRDEDVLPEKGTMVTLSSGTAYARDVSSMFKS